MEAGLFSSENMPVDGSETFRELDICRAKSEFRLWEESWRVVGFFFFFLSFCFPPQNKVFLKTDIMPGYSTYLLVSWARSLSAFWMKHRTLETPESNGGYDRPIPPALMQNACSVDSG